MLSDSRIGRWPLSLALAVALAAAAAPTGAQIIGSATTDTPNSGPTATAVGPDGSVWFVEQTGNRLGEIDPFRTNVDEVNLVIPNSQPTALTIDTSGTVWFCESGTDRIGQYIPSSGALIEYPLDGAGLGLAGITLDKFQQGVIWFTENLTNRIGRLDTFNLSLQYYYSWSGDDIGPVGISMDALGRVWFTEYRAGRVGYVDTASGWVWDYFWLTPGCGPWGITTDLDNDVWITERNTSVVDLLTPDTGQMFEFAASATSFNAQPMGISVQQNNQSQTIVGWADYGTGQVNLLNASTGTQSQIQASSPTAAPTDVSFANDNSLWFPEYNTSQTTGWYFDPNTLVRRPRAAGDLRYARLNLLAAPRPVFATLRGAEPVRIVLVKQPDKGSHGHQKQATKDKHKPKNKTLNTNKMDQGKPGHKSHPFQKGRAG